MSGNLSSDRDWLITGPGDAHWTLVLAHGAGQGMGSQLIATFARLLGDRRLRVIRFEFPYMARFGQTGVRRPPDPESRLRESWLQMIDELIDRQIDTDRLLIGGKSLGGRIACLIAEERPVAGLVCLGYPFHPPGRPESVRTGHLRTLAVPTLIWQGTRDPFGRPDEVASYELSPFIRLVWIDGGEHSFKSDRRRVEAGSRTWNEPRMRWASSSLAIVGAPETNELGYTRCRSSIGTSPGVARSARPTCAESSRTGATR